MQPIPLNSALSIENGLLFFVILQVNKLMKKGILVLFLCFGAVCAFAQTPPNFYIANDTTLCQAGPVTLNAMISVPGVNYSTTSYSVTSIPYTPDPYNGGPFLTYQTNGDDEVHGPFPIGFTFCFMGVARTQFYIGTNGWVGFSNGPTTYTSLAIPSTNVNVPKDCIMGPWQDWYPGFNNSQVHYAVYGTAPWRRLVVAWDNTPMFSCTNNIGRFQIVLFETSNIIENHIQTKPNCLNWGGGTAVQGLHDISGTIAFPVPGRNSTQWTTSNNAYRFTPNGPFTPYQITWYDVSTNTQIGTGNSIVVNPPSTNNYAAIVTFECSLGTDTDTVAVTISPPLLALTTFSDDTCLATVGSATVLVSGGFGPYSYLWSNGDTNMVADSLIGGTYTVITTDVNGCTRTDVVTVTSLPPPVANFSHNPNIVTLLDPDCYFTDLSLNATQWYWDFGDGDTSTLQNPVHIYMLDGTYTVTLIVSNQWGCTDTITQTVLVEAYYTFFVPNSFTPNGNTENDTWVPKFTGIDEKSYTLIIFDRWGQVIFKTNDPFEAWNGKVNNSGKVVQEDTYVYLITFEDFQTYFHELSGKLTVLK
jgi:gliding motility-associated-like protein